jgi:predicted protein tyrosine phosphatase
VTARREWHANGVSWRVNHDGAFVATWWPNDAHIVIRTFRGYTRREAARLVAAERREYRLTGRVPA